VQPQPLFDAFVETKFPLVDAVMGLQVHMAPRVILINTVPSAPIVVDSSILAGCGYSVPWVKSLLHPGSVNIAKDHPNYNTYVDDCANVATGSSSDVQDEVVHCALAFAKIVYARKFTLSPKSAIVASSLKLGRRIAAELATCGIIVQVLVATRDVGVMFTAGVWRCASGSNKRMEKAVRRTKRIANISKVTRSARKLFVSGAFPQATWGHQCVGIPPTQVLALRRLAASSTGVSVKSQRCLNSCVAICFGKRADPWQSIVKELALLWMKLMPSFYAKSRFDLALAWSKAKQDVCLGPTPDTHQQIASMKVQWRKVTGPISNMVATLYAVGFLPQTFSQWVSPDGVCWNLPTSPDFPFCPVPLVHALQDQIASLLWAEASTHVLNGKGLYHGIDYNLTICVLRKYRKLLAYDKAAALETILCGACWSPQRKFLAGLTSADLSVCVLCGANECDDYHQFWSCPSLATSTWPEVESTNYLVPAAASGMRDFPCLWLRGLLPSELLVTRDHPIPPPRSVDNVSVYDPFGITPDPEVWPPGLYGTDASGGRWGSYPLLRRCGCGVARLTSMDPPFRLEWGAWFPLVGELQTVPRAELYAIYMVVAKVPAGVIYIVSDSELNVNLYAKTKFHACSSINGDLWRAIYHHIESKPITLKLYWVPGHLDTTVAKVKTRVPDVHFLLNHSADHFADRAALEEELGMHLASRVLYYGKLVGKIQRRLVRVIVSHTEKHSFERKTFEPRALAPTINDLVESTAHNLEISDSMFRCLDCSGAVSKNSTNVKNWLKAKCSALPYDDRQSLVPIPKWHLIQIGNTVPHSTHELHTHRGIVICKVCGAIGIKKCKLLVGPCRLHCTVATQKSLDNLMTGVLPPSVKAWPRRPNLGVWQAPVVVPSVLPCSIVPLPVAQNGTSDDILESSRPLHYLQARVHTSLDDSDLELFEEDPE